jgi:hypothetical protein
VFPADYNDFREIRVVDGDGKPMRDAVLTYRGVQIFGRSDASGMLRFPWPAELTDVPEYDRIREHFFFLSAPGYVPVLLERSVLENETGPVKVTLKARELLVSVHEMVPHPEVLRLAANPDRQSSILEYGVDLIPLPSDFLEILTWDDAHRAAYGEWAHSYDKKLASGKLELFWGFGTTSTGPYTSDHEFGGESAEKLADALGREPTEHWPEYARWYYGRWDYDEREGRFDVVLPFAGRFLLAVGEYNRGAKGEATPDGYPTINGKLTHVLYIDARNPAELKSKLLIHPQG